MLSKRLLFKNKIIRLYEEDIWGIFFRKQKRRDMFFKHIGYQLFLEILFHKASDFVNKKNQWKKLNNNNKDKLNNNKYNKNKINNNKYNNNKYNNNKYNNNKDKINNNKYNNYKDKINNNKYNNNNKVNINFKKKKYLFSLDFKWFLNHHSIIHKISKFNIIKLSNFNLLSRIFYINKFKKEVKQNYMLTLKYLNVFFIKINVEKINFFLNLNFTKYFFSKIGYLYYLTTYSFIDYIKYNHIINYILLTNNKISNLFIYFIIYNNLLANGALLKDKVYFNKYYWKAVKISLINKNSISSLNDLFNFLIFVCNNNINQAYTKYIIKYYLFLKRIYNKRSYFIQKKLIQYLTLLYHKWETYDNKREYFVNKTLVNTTSWARRVVKRNIYALRNLVYQKYNNFEDPDSIFAGLKFDALSINTDNLNPKYYGTLLLYINILKRKHPFLRSLKKEISAIITKNSYAFNKTEYLLSFYASNNIYKFFKKIRFNYLNSILVKKNKLNNKLSSFYLNTFENSSYVNKFTRILNNKVILSKYTKFILAKVFSIKKKSIFYSLKKKKTKLQKMFTLNLIPIVKYVKKKSKFCSFYKHHMLKIWKFRKFYGCLTDYELNSICYKAYKMHGDILHQFIMLLECRLDTLLYRSGMVASIFEARQLINHKNVLVNNNIITKRSYVINNTDIVMFTPFFLLKKKKDILSRIYKHGFVFYPPVYLEVNYKFFMILFLFDILKAQQVPFNFKLTGYDINNILYYYY